MVIPGRGSGRSSFDSGKPKGRGPLGPRAVSAPDAARVFVDTTVESNRRSSTGQRPLLGGHASSLSGEDAARGEDHGEGGDPGVPAVVVHRRRGLPAAW